MINIVKLRYKGNKMKQFMKIMIVTSMSLLMSSAFATITKIYPKKTPAPEKWEIIKKDDGYIFLLWPESPNKLIIHANGTTKEGKISDDVTVTCNGKDNILKPNDTLTCYGNFEDTISLFVKEEDFHNGAAGTSLLTRKN